MSEILELTEGLLCTTEMFNLQTDAQCFKIADLCSQNDSELTCLLMSVGAVSEVRISSELRADL